MKRSILIFVLLFLICAGINSFAKELAELIPSADELDPVIVSSEPEYYNQDNLWDYINGGAPAYIAYGFEQVVTLVVMNPDSVEMVVDIYDMADSLNAFGIYSQEKSSKGKPVTFGSNGMQYNNAIYFWQDRYYVKLIAYETSARANEFLIQIADIMSRKIPSGGSIPALFSAFPVNNKIPNSEKFTRQDVLGMQYLYNGYSAEYDHDGEKYYIFLIQCANGDDAIEKFEKLRLDKNGTNTLFDFADPTFAGTDSYYGNILFAQKGIYMIGVLGKIENSQGEKILSEVTSVIE
ncbi:hypothetical protein JXQ31_16505 [candidate division KSB1 bacterium]|nr:hypothetical protein [candidate division KSB1 bacterium]